MAKIMKPKIANAEHFARSGKCGADGLMVVRENACALTVARLATDNFPRFWQ